MHGSSAACWVGQAGHVVIAAQRSHMQGGAAHGPSTRTSSAVQRHREGSGRHSRCIYAGAAGSNDGSCRQQGGPSRHPHPAHAGPLGMSGLQGGNRSQERQLLNGHQARCSA